MATVFLVCAVFGSVLLLCQFGMALLGIGGDHDFGGGHHDFGGGHAGAAGGHDAAHAGGQTTEAGHEEASSIFKLLSLRALTAAVAFFGLAGTASLEVGLPTILAVNIALAAGVAALVLVAWMMQLLHRFDAEGNVHIELAAGSTGAVYLNIPGQNSGAGKVTIEIQGRTMEYLAVTPGDALDTGVEVVVTRVVGSDKLEVEALAK